MSIYLLHALYYFFKVQFHSYHLKQFQYYQLKLLVFNAAVISVYLIFAGIFGISLDDFKTLGKYGAYVFLAVGNAVFVLYDIAVSRTAMFYISRFHNRVKKMLKL